MPGGYAPGTGYPAAPPGESRLFVSRWTKRVAWMGVAATGVLSLVAARAVPGRSATPSSGNTPGSQVRASSGETLATGGSALQPANELPQPSTRQPYVRSGGS